MLFYSTHSIVLQFGGLVMVCMTEGMKPFRGSRSLLYSKCLPPASGQTPFLGQMGLSVPGADGGESVAGDCGGAVPL